jgi:hypothetical protein
MLGVLEQHFVRVTVLAQARAFQAKETVRRISLYVQRMSTLFRARPVLVGVVAGGTLHPALTVVASQGEIGLYLVRSQSHVDRVRKTADLVLDGPSFLPVTGEAGAGDRVAVLRHPLCPSMGKVAGPAYPRFSRRLAAQVVRVGGCFQKVMFCP